MERLSTPGRAGSDEEVIELLQRKGLSIRHLDAETRERIRDFISRWYVEKGASQGDIAKMIGNKTSGYVSWLARQLGIQAREFEEARLKGIHEKVRKHERRPFDGTDEDKAYLLGLRHGDLSASRPFGDATRVSTSTTHPTFALLFHRLFSPYGHVSQHPRYKKDTRTYEWNLHVILDSSFEFLLMEREACWQWISSKDSTRLAYLAGVVDAEGSISIYGQRGRTVLMVTIYNTSLDLENFLLRTLEELGYRPRGPYLDKKAGTMTSKYEIKRKKDYWKVVVTRFSESQSLLARLPLRYEEKVARQRLALSLTCQDPWASVCGRVSNLRSEKDRARGEFVDLAKSEFLKNHPEPH